MNQVLAQLLLDNWLAYCAEHLSKPVEECRRMFEGGMLVCKMDNGLILTHEAHYVALRAEMGQVMRTSDVENSHEDP